MSRLLDGWLLVFQLPPLQFVSFLTSPIHRSAKQMSNDNGEPLDKLENRLLTGTRDLHWSHSHQAGPEEINGTCNWVWSLGCVGVAASRVSPMAALSGWWFVRGVGGGFMSHTGWQRRVRLRTLVHFTYRDVRTVWQNMENGTEDYRS